MSRDTEHSTPDLTDQDCTTRPPRQQANEPEHHPGENEKKNERTTPTSRPPGVPRPSVLTDVHDLLDDLDWRTAVDETITARSRLQPGWDPALYIGANHDV